MWRTWRPFAGSWIENFHSVEISIAIPTSNHVDFSTNNLFEWNSRLFGQNVATPRSKSVDLFLGEWQSPLVTSEVDVKLVTGKHYSCWKHLLLTHN